MIVNYLLMSVGQVLEMIAFFTSLVPTVFHALAQQFYFAGNPVIDNNEENQEEND